MKKEPIIAFWGIMFLALILAGCGKSDNEQKAERHAAAAKAKADEAAAFKIAVTPTMDCLPLFLLKDSVLYDTSKVDIRLKPFNSHMDIDTALTGGSIQAAATELVRALELRRTHHVSLRAVAVTPLQWTLVGDRKNKITTLKALGNHMVAMSRFSATDWLTSIVRKRAKTDDIIFSIQMNDVQLRLQMLRNDEMDAAWLPEPQATKAILDGNVKLAESADEGHKFGLIVYRQETGSIADKREAELQEFKAAYNKAVGLINRNGIKHYSALIKKYMGADDKTIARLPRITYTQTEGPSRADMLTAEKIRFQKHTPRVKIE